MKVNDFRISVSDQENVPIFPLEVKSSISKRKGDLTSLDGNQRPSIYLPLISSGSRIPSKTGDIEVRDIGNDKWLQYDRRVCVFENRYKNILFGKEYLIESGAKVMDSVIPVLDIHKKFPFESQEQLALTTNPSPYDFCDQQI